MESNFTTSQKSRENEPKSKETDRTVTVIDTQS
jgi:hypothetical protein